MRLFRSPAHAAVARCESSPSSLWPQTSYRSSPDWSAETEALPVRCTAGAC